MINIESVKNMNLFNQKTFLVLIPLVSWSLLVCHCQKEDLVGFYESQQERVKRQVPPGMGGESCLQIFSVPKRSVACEPTSEVRNELTDLRENVNANKAAFDELNVKIEELDPDKPRELPEEVKERLNTIDEVKTNQAGHAEYLKRLESDIGRVLGTYSLLGYSMPVLFLNTNQKKVTVI